MVLRNPFSGWRFKARGPDLLGNAPPLKLGPLRQRPTNQTSKKGSKMQSSIGTLVFCTSCGNLLDSTSSPTITCEMCTSTTHDSGATKTVTTRSNASAFPSSLRLKRSAVQTLAPADLQTEAEIGQTCPECGNGKMWFYTLQLRSADEGVGFWLDASGVCFFPFDKPRRLMETLYLGYSFL